MKKIVQKEARTININSINNDSIVGIDWQEQGKTFIVATSEGYKPLDTFLSVVYCWSEKSLKKAVGNVLSLGGDAFLFDTKKELFRWLGE